MHLEEREIRKALEKAHTRKRERVKERKVLSYFDCIMHVDVYLVLRVITQGKGKMW